MADPSRPRDQPADPSPLDVLPGLTDVSRVIADAVAVTDIHRRVVVWNDAADALYGIPAADALGRPIDALYDSTIVGESTSSAGARTIALTTGSWRGRVADRPRVGRLVGQELVIETILSRVDTADGRLAGVISVKRDVTASVRLERELSTLTSLATATGAARTREAVVQRGLEVLTGAVNATLGMVAVPDADRLMLLAQYRVPEVLQRLAAEIGWAESPAVRSVATPGRVVRGNVALLPLTPATRRGLLDARVRTLVMVGLHREEELVGLVMLGWDRDDPVVPSDAILLVVASHLARGLENARLIEEIVRRAESQRELSQRLRALDELTRVGGHVTVIEELAERSARLINSALGAAGTAYGLLAPDGQSYAVSRMAEVRPAIAEWLTTARPDARTAFKRWRAGEGPFLEPFAPGRVTAESLALAREAGVTAYAAIPIRVDDAVVGGIAAYFDRPAADLHVDRGTLERIATITSISLENFRLRERLQSSEQRYRSIFDASPDAILVIATDGPVVDANEAALRLYRADRAWLLGRRATDLAHFDLAHIRQRADALSVGQTFRTRAIGVRRGGEVFSAEVDVAAAEIDGGRRYLVRIRDLTEQERLQAELVQAQKMEATGQLVSGVAHELNNPLAAILGFSQLIRRDGSLPEDLRHNADLLVEEATRTKRIVQNLLDFAQQRPPERHPTSIRALVDSVLTLQSYSLGKGLIETEVDIPNDLPLVELDRGQLQQVLVNLTHNAIYAIRQGGGSRLRIAASAEGSATARRVRITVTDDGPGVAPEHVARLFEAFFTTKPPADGTGLGLPVSYGIVAAHGGELRYGPSALGRGAAFTFDLPVQALSTEQRPPLAAPPRVDERDLPDPTGAAGMAGTTGMAGAAGMAGSAGTSRTDRPGSASAAAGPPPAASTDADPGAPDRRVLVLDDETSIRIFLGKALSALGYTPVVVESGAEAVELVRDRAFMAILCDHQMPGMSGVEVYESLVAADPGLAQRFVMMSGDVLNPALDTFATSHAVSVLAKPFDLETLDRTIRALADGQPRG